jgi:menaquinol-cytochrome c reductase iron-sulfur subunit
MDGPHEGRRSALARIVVAGSAFIATALAGLAGLVVAPRPPASTRRWRRAISAFDVTGEKPVAVVLAERHADGWYQTRKQTVVFVDRDGPEGSGYRALSGTCRHLGCGVRWDDGKKQFLCPCHGGVYDRAGRVVAGPPPGPLDRLSVRVNPRTSEIEVDL